MLIGVLLGRRDLERLGTDLNARQRHERQVTVEDPLLNGAELRLVGLDVYVDVLQLANLLPVAVDDRLAKPLTHSPLRVPLLVALDRFGHFRVVIPGTRLSDPGDSTVSFAPTCTRCSG